jgi:hypothetical protein
MGGPPYDAMHTEYWRMIVSHYTRECGEWGMIMCVAALHCGFRFVGTYFPIIFSFAYFEYKSLTGREAEA